ncbi:hypothetical protein [Paenibacillus sp. FSL E2-0177]|uniref:hypothetical protein n=1 Tax=Paenibacillus sp. FSL E2-0177 TaxID=2921360 RepID=UPI0030EC3696
MNESNLMPPESLQPSRYSQATSALFYGIYTVHFTVPATSALFYGIYTVHFTVPAIHAK